MNIFVLDKDIKLCAQYHCDKHLVKMITEHNQILASVKWKSQGITKKKQITKKDTNKFTDFPRKNSDGTPNPYGIGFQYHPCTVWAGESIDNYIWLCNLTLEMCKEYTKRYGKIHAGEEIVKWHKYNSPPLAIIGMTPFVQAMPDDVKDKDAITAYRNYYKKYKVDFAKWIHTETPLWFKEIKIEEKTTNSLLV